MGAARRGSGDQADRVAKRGRRPRAEAPQPAAVANGHSTPPPEDDIPF